MKKHHPAKKHMEAAMKSMEKAHKSMSMKMDKVGSPKEEMKAAKKGDYKANSAKKTNKPNESKK